MVIRSLFEILIRSSMQGNDITLTCDECFVVMEYFADLALEDFSLDDIRLTLRKHINHCPDCREHHLQKLSELEEQWQQNKNAQKPA